MTKKRTISETSLRICLKETTDMLESIKSPEDLKSMNLADKQVLAREIRQKITDTVLENGGHLASNLGAVELTIALHSVLCAPKDKLLFDVGHQCYAHKLLTGRYARFDTLRKEGGISGFTRPDESEFDTAASGHASDSISLAIGLARARDLKGENHSVVAVVGDGALTGGMCYEALNDAGQSKVRMVIVLNDNEMSISKNVGSLSKHLTHMRQSNAYRSFKQHLRKAIDRMPKGSRFTEKLLSRIKDSLKTLFVNDLFFDSLDIEYLGPIDGHDIREMERVLKSALTYDKPVVVHVVTKKGTGYKPAEDTPDRFHSVPPRDKSEEEKGENAAARVGDWLVRKAAEDRDIVCVSAAMITGTGLAPFAKAYPERCLDTGIAEEHAAAMAAGIALGGGKPYLALYSTFMQRAYDQISTDAALNRAHVRLLIDRSGLNGPDGETHQGVFDTGLLRGLPGFTVCAPGSILELYRMLDLSLDANTPIAVKYPKMLPLGDKCACFAYGQWEILAEGKEICLIAYGRMLNVAINLSKRLAEKNIQAALVNARFLKPLDEKTLTWALDTFQTVYTLEDSVKAGSLGEEIASRAGKNARVIVKCVPDRYIPSGTIAQQLRFCGLDEETLFSEILRNSENRELL